MTKPKYLTKLSQIPQLSEAERTALQPVAEKFVFRTNDYYQNLIDWNDPDDPLRRIVMPHVEELNEWGELDASSESAYTRAPGLEHKYRDTALLLVNDVCGAYCRFCFRKRLFMDDNDEVVRDVSEGLAYIREHPEISNVLLTGGDPLLMSTKRLEKIIASLRAIDHVQIIRIGSKMPVFNPYRVLNDPSLLEMITRYSTPTKRIYIMAHFNHPRELTEPAIEGLARLQESGAITVNQTPLIQGVNDDPQVLAELFDRLSFIGTPPYYVFQCRPTLGNETYAVPLEAAFELFMEAQTLAASGLAKRARFAMSHKTGKAEVVDLHDDHIYLRYHRAADAEKRGKLLVFKRNPNAYWLDDYLEPEAEVERPFPQTAQPITINTLTTTTDKRVPAPTV
ncbi:MAG: KamA family radical SAM protein [Chloroflexota bacterium]